MAETGAPETALTFGALLRYYRLAAGLTQEALAERAGLSVRAISDFERAVPRRPRPDTLALLATTLRLSPQERDLFAAAVGTVLHAPDATATPPPTARPLVGRAREMAALQRHLGGEGPPVLLLAGPPGIGKSRLLQEAGRWGTQSGWTVLLGGCQRRGGHEPYAPLLGALQRYIQGRLAVHLRADLHGCAWLVRLLPELADGPIGSLPAWTVPPEQEQRLMVAAVGRFLDNVAGPAGTLLVLDDLQWAGPDALALLTALVRAAPEGTLRVVGAYRDTEVTAAEDLATTLGDLAQAGLAAHRTLPPLTPEEAGQLLDVLWGGDAAGRPDLRRRLLERAGGLPFFLVSYAQTRQQQEEDGAAEVPWDVAQSVRQRVGALPPAARAVLGVAAVAGRVVPRTLLIAAVDQPGEDLLEALKTLCQARLLEEQGPAMYHFAHDAIREVVEADLGTARRAHLHRHIAQILEGGSDTPNSAALAFHYARSDEEGKALQYLELAGDHARAQYAHATAAAYYLEAATRQEGRDHASAARMREQAGVMWQTAGNHERAQVLLEQAAEDYGVLDDLESLGRVVASIGNGHKLAGTAPPVVYLEQTLARLEGQGVRRSVPALCARLSELYHIVGRYTDQLAAADRAVAAARVVGEEELLADALAARAWALYCWGRQEDALPDLEEVHGLAERTEQLAILCDTLQTAAGIYGARGEAERQRVYSDRAVACAERLGDPVTLVTHLSIRGLLAFFQGAWGLARADCERALAISRRDAPWTRTDTSPAAPHDPQPADEGVPEGAASGWLIEGLPRLYLTQLCLAEGKLEEATHHLEAFQAGMMADVHDIVLVQSAWAHLDLVAGRPATAAARLAPFTAQPDPREGWEWQVMPLRVLDAWTHLDLGEVDRAATVVAQALARARTAQYPRALVEALWMVARVAVQQGQELVACRALEEGLMLARRIQYPYGEARLLYTCGLLDVRQANHIQARTRFESALVAFRHWGRDGTLSRSSWVSTP